MPPAEINVIKRDGTKQPLNLNKFHKVAAHACEGLGGVSVSELELKTALQFRDNITSSDIQETLIKAAADMITEDAPNYQFVAGRLINYNLRKEVYGSYEPPHIFEHYKKYMDEGHYTTELDEWYSAEEWDKINQWIKHDRDEQLTYAAMEQFRGKYLLRNRVNNEMFETPQMAIMLIAMTIFGRYEDDRMRWVKDFYDAVSLHDISLPTPIMAGVRSVDKQFSSCTLIEAGDSIDSLCATDTCVTKYISNKAGIGIGASRFRAIGSDVRGGRTFHTGIIPFLRKFQGSVKSCSQGGVRGGAATVYYPIWHYEAPELLVLKDPKQTEDNRVARMDYGVQFNKVMYERYIQGGNITLFSPQDVPDLFDAFYTDADLFRELYEKYERAYSIRKRTVPAKELFRTFLKQRQETGRIYLMNVDHANSHGAFVPEGKNIVRMSNLCCEITLPTTPLEHEFDEEGEISLCTLAAINWGKIKDPSDFERPCEIVVRALDALLDYQYYPIKAAEIGTKQRRPLGVGIINFAYWLARNDSNYSVPNLQLVHEYAEAWSYYLIKASVDLAEEKGACPLSNETKYGRFGQVPIDTYKKDVDTLVKPTYNMDWKTLRNRLKKVGIRNSTLMALMPSETSSQISNSTNGIEPPRALVSVKQSKDGVLTQVVPGIWKYKNKYELLWDQKSPRGYLSIMAVLQKFIDQAISVNTSYNPAHYPEGKLSERALMDDLLFHYKMGGKTLYYFNTNDGATDELGEDEDCDSCKV